MTVSLKAKNVYSCSCAKHESETLQRARNGASVLIWHRLVGTCVCIARSTR